MVIVLMWVGLLGRNNNHNNEIKARQISHGNGGWLTTGTQLGFFVEIGD